MAEEMEWVVLKQITTEEQSRFTQIGPFSTAEVLKRVHAGELAFGDYAWKKGMKEWVYIRDLPEFQPEGASSSPPKIPLHETSVEFVGDISTGAITGENTESRESETTESRESDEAELLSSVVLQEISPVDTKPLFDEQVPDEAEGIDLAMMDFDQALNSPNDKETLNEDFEEITEADRPEEEGGTQWNDDGSAIMDFSQSKELFGDAELGEIERARKEHSIKAEKERELELLEQAREHQKLKYMRWIRYIGLASAGCLVLYFLFIVLLPAEKPLSFDLNAKIEPGENTPKSAGGVQEPPLEVPMPSGGNELAVVSHGEEEAKAPGESETSGQLNQTGGSITNLSGGLTEVEPPGSAPETTGTSPAPSHSLETAPRPLLHPAKVDSKPVSLDLARWTWITWSSGQLKPLNHRWSEPLSNDGLRSLSLNIPSSEQAGSRLTIRIVGKSGDLLNGRSIHKDVNIVPLEKVPSRLAFAELALPLGYYDVYGLSQKLTDSLKIGFGTKEPEYVNEIANYRGKIKGGQKKELTQVLASLKTIEEHIKLLEKGIVRNKSLKSWIHFEKSWKQGLLSKQPTALRKISWHNADNYYYPEEWIEVRAVRLAIINAAARRGEGLKRKKPVAINMRSQRRQIDDLKTRVIRTLKVL